MSILAAYAVPHPPLIIPAVGRGQEQGISDTIASFTEIARRAAEHHPDTIVITSPHAPAFRDGFFISTDSAESGSMAQFHQPQESLGVDIDTEFAHAVARKMERRGIPIGKAPRGMEPIDHATYVPLYFLNQALDLSGVRIVRIGLSGLPDADHEQLGRFIAQVSDELGRRTALIASGDWSHKLKDDGPYGYVPEGPQFDRALADIFERGALDELFKLDPVMCDAAAECGLRSFMIMAGALEGSPYTAELLSYEGPFGVGYGVAAFEVEGAGRFAPASRGLALTRDAAREGRASDERGAREGEDSASLAGSWGEDLTSAEVDAEIDAAEVDPLVALARATVESYIRDRKLPSVPPDFPGQYTRRRAGVFVSLHEGDDLRGCIGTISACQPSIADEVIANAVSASTKDPRFPAVRPDELDYLSYSVDVLDEAEPVESLAQLDPKRYGVIVTRGFRRGLLLPDLEGVDTVMDQLSIAKRKAGIGLDEDVEVERFEVIRHSAGGEARCDARRSTRGEPGRSAGDEPGRNVGGEAHRG